MQHFLHIDEKEKEKIFYKRPGEFNKDTEKVKLAVELKPEGYILKSTPQNQIIEKIKNFFTNQ